MFNVTHYNPKSLKTEVTVVDSKVLESVIRHMEARGLEVKSVQKA